MHQALKFAAIVMVVAAFAAGAEEGKSIVGKWEGKSAKSGKNVGLEFKEDKSVVMSEDGKEESIPGVTIKWEMVDSEKGHLDIIMTAEGKELRGKMLFQWKGDKLVIGGPKEDESRPATIEESDDPVEFTKK
jgi:hypothetical protein